jgi:hypothetical protein
MVRDAGGHTVADGQDGHMIVEHYFIFTPVQYAPECVVPATMRVLYW